MRRGWGPDQEGQLYPGPRGPIPSRFQDPVGVEKGYGPRIRARALCPPGTRALCPRGLNVHGLAVAELLGICSAHSMSLVYF